MWRYCVGKAGLNMAAIGSMSVIAPFASSVKPAGVFIHALAEMMKNVDRKPPSTSGMPQRKCARGVRRFQPYR